MNEGIKPRNKKENHTFLPGKVRTDPADPAPSVPSRVSNRTIFPSAGEVELRNSVLRKLSKPWMTPEYTLAAAATIRSISIANLPSWTTGSALRTAPTTGFSWTAMPANTTTKPRPSLSPSWGPTSPFPWLNRLIRTCPHSASNLTWVPK